MNTLTIGLLGVLAIGAGYVEAPPAGPAVVPAAELVTPAVMAPDTRTVRLRIEGMTCGGCAISARIVLERLNGVEEAEVSYEQKLAVVSYDPSKVTPARMIAALKEKLEYSATVVESTKR